MYFEQGHKLVEAYGHKVLSAPGLGRLLQDTDGKTKDFLDRMGMIYAKAYFLSYFVDKVTLVEFSKAVDTQTFFDNPLQIEALHSALCSTAGRNVFLDLRNNFVSIKLGIEKQLFPKENCLFLNNLLSMVWQTQADIKSKKITSQRERPDDTFDAKKKMRSDP